MLSINPFYAIAGVAVALLIGLIGVGGGALMTPLLVLVFGFYAVTAVGTDLLQTSATIFVGTPCMGPAARSTGTSSAAPALGSVPATEPRFGASCDLSSPARCSSWGAVDFLIAPPIIRAATVEY